MHGSNSLNANTGVRVPDCYSQMDTLTCWIILYRFEIPSQVLSLNLCISYSNSKVNFFNYSGFNLYTLYNLFNMKLMEECIQLSISIHCSQCCVDINYLLEKMCSHSKYYKQMATFIHYNAMAMSQSQSVPVSSSLEMCPVPV